VIKKINTFHIPSPVVKPFVIVLITGFFYLFSNTLTAQDQPYISDSLISRLAVLEDNLEKVQTLNELALHHSETMPDKALYYSKKA